MAFNTINPADGEIIAAYEFLDTRALDAALEQSAKAFSSWRTSAASERKKVCLKIADLLEQPMDATKQSTP